MKFIFSYYRIEIRDSENYISSFPHRASGFKLTIGANGDQVEEEEVVEDEEEEEEEEEAAAELDDDDCGFKRGQR